MELTLPQNLLWLVLLIWVINEGVKKAVEIFKPNAGKGYKELLPFASMALGIIGAATLGKVPLPQSVVSGILVGAIASGGYDTIKPFLEMAKGFFKVIMIATLLMTLSGCVGSLSPAMRADLHNARMVADVLDKRCRAGDMDACKECSTHASQTLRILDETVQGRDPANLPAEPEVVTPPTGGVQ